MKKTQQLRGPRSTISLSSDRRTLSVRIPVSFRRHRAGKQVITPPDASFPSPARFDNALIQALVRAHHWRELLEHGEHVSAAELAKVKRLNDSYLMREAVAWRGTPVKQYLCGVRRLLVPEHARDSPARDTSRRADSPSQ